MVDWGTVPAWVAAGVAALALVAASISARANLRGIRNQQKQLKYQQEQLERLENDKRRDQAAKIGAWLFPRWHYEDDSGAQIIDYRKSETYIRLRNDSNLPIYFVFVWIEVAGKVFGQSHELIMTPPGDQELSFEKGIENISQGLTVATFTDAQGIHWMRTPLGNLRELTEDERVQILGQTFSSRDWQKVMDVGPKSPEMRSLFP